MNGSSFDGRSVLITGGGSGIGRATARLLAARGARVHIGDLDPSTMDQTREGFETIAAHRLDVTDESSIAAFLDEAVARSGPPDVLVNLAGVLGFANSHEVTVSDWQRLLDVNLTGTFLMCRAVITAMLDEPADADGHRGVIVNTASTAAHIGQAWAAAYCASKGGVLALTRALAVEYARRGIRVNSVSPGSISTPMLGEFAFPDGADQTLLSRTVPLTGMGTPDDVAAAIAYLAGDRSGFVVGADLRVDGATTT